MMLHSDKQNQISEAVMLTENKRRTNPCYYAVWVALMMLVLCFDSIYAQVSSSKQSPWEGRAVFRDKGCIECHTVYGRDEKDGPDLGRRKFYGTHLELAALMWNHFPKMFKKMQKTRHQHQEFDEQEMTQLLSYLSFIRYIGEPGSERKGRKLLESKGCRKCHEFGGVGGDIAPEIGTKNEYLSPLRMVETMWNHGPNMLELFEENDIKRPQFKGNEIVDLAVAIRSYMSTSKVPVGSFDIGDPGKGKILAEEKGCMRCHSFRGIGGELAPDFDDVDLSYSVTQIAGKMWNHGPEMWKIMKSEDIAIPVFEEGQMADVIAYLYALKIEDALGDIEMGSKIVGDRGCLSCHSVRGHGADISADLATMRELNSPQAMITAMWNHAPAMREEHLEKKLKWPEFNGRDMANLYAYLRSLSSGAEDQQ
jgi:cytochrome c2